MDFFLSENVLKLSSIPKIEKGIRRLLYPRIPSDNPLIIKVIMTAKKRGFTLFSKIVFFRFFPSCFPEKKMVNNRYK